MPGEEREIAVSAALRPWIAGVRIAAIGAYDGERTIIEPPDHAAELALRILPHQRSDLVVMGPRTRALYHVGTPGPFCVRARIEPGRARLLLGRPVHRLLDRVVSLSDLWGEAGGHLARALSEVGSDPAAIGAQPFLERLEEALMSRLSAQKPGDRFRSDLVRRAGLLLTAGAAGTDLVPGQVHAVAARLNVSERHLRNLFSEAVGVSPKHFARLDRLRTVLAHAGTTHWARLATRAGYYDQSHMNAEFRRMMGVPPSAYVAARLPAASPCRPLAVPPVR
jgi:AraC-like DNA-binding protein